MKYSKPTLKKPWEKVLPPVTVNFAPPAVKTGFFKEKLTKRIIEMFGMEPNPDDPRLSESAKQI